jgi:nitrogen regulatory protein P-II 1
MTTAKKRIEAIIRPYKLDELSAALGELGVPGMTITEVKGFGRSAGKRDLAGTVPSGDGGEVYRGSAYVVDFMPKLKVEIVVLEVFVSQIVDIIASSARTGKIGDGKVFVSEVDSWRLPGL